MNVSSSIEEVAFSTAADAIPMDSGSVSIGSLRGCARFIIVESRNWPGYWYDIRLSDNTIAGLPTTSENLRKFLNNDLLTPCLRWTTHIDIGGQFAEGERSNAA